VPKFSRDYDEKAERETPVERNGPDPIDYTHDPELEPVEADEPDGAAPEPVISQRLTRAGRGTTTTTRFQDENIAGSYSRRSANVLNLDLLTPEKPFIMYLGSGNQREGDFAQQIDKRIDAEVLCVDTKHGGASLDLTRANVTRRLTELAAEPHCLGVLASIDCSSWSALKFAPGGPTPDRDLDNLLGVTDEHGRITNKAAYANRMADNATGVCSTAAAHNKTVVIESPVSRAAGSPYELPGREKHACYFDHPSVCEFAETYGGEPVTFDQCCTGADAQKSTKLLATRGADEIVKRTFGRAA
jgi:hypothetical protein